MPTARRALMTTLIDKILYAVGGEGKDKIMNIHDAYNSNTIEWITKSSMPTPRHHAATATVDGKMYIIRGRVAGTLPITNVNVTKMYDPEMDKWTILDRIPTKRSESSAASIDNTIYVFEGKDITKTYNNTKNTILKLIDGNPRNHSLLRVMDCLPYLLIIKSLL
jgi:N-acetylneuraminic acid mutarotase